VAWPHARLPGHRFKKSPLPPDGEGQPFLSA